MIDFLMAKTSSYWSLSRHCCITALWQKHPLIGYSLNNAIPSHCQHCCITLSLAKTSSYCGHYLNTVTSPPHWQKHPLIGHSLNEREKTSGILLAWMRRTCLKLSVILSIMLYPLIVKNVLLLVTISTLPSGQVWGSRWTKIQGAIFWTYCDVNRCFKGKLN